MRCLLVLLIMMLWEMPAYSNEDIDMNKACFQPGVYMLRRPKDAELDEYFPKASPEQIASGDYQPGARPGLPWELSKYCLDLIFGEHGGYSTDGPIYKKPQP